MDKRVIGLKNVKFTDKKREYGVAEIWLHRSLMLLKTKILIEFNAYVRSIALPVGDFLTNWKNPFVIPDREKFLTTYWCRLDVSVQAKNVHSVKNKFSLR